jgi:hypothetical protein
MDNDSLSKMAETYIESSEDEKAFLKSQQQVIINQSKEINKFKKEIEKLASEIEKLMFENAQLRATAPKDNSSFQVSDEETICVVQLAILKNHAMVRELTMEEAKKTEVYVKTLKEIRGKKVVEQEDPVETLSNEDLLKMMDSLNKAES